MHLNKACLHVLSQLEDLLNQINAEDYHRKSVNLNQGTIGQHIRHTLEFFICLHEGYNIGLVNYDSRSHNTLIETDKTIALDAVRRVTDFVNELSFDKKLLLEVGYDPLSEIKVSVETNAMRELIYNIEHAVHHMAIIKIALNEVARYVKIPESFGVAASTLRYNDAIALQGER
jgi:hypothetical protein